MFCPRRIENPVADQTFPGEDQYDNEETCSFCGSLSPELFMARLEAGDVILEPTDKCYKAYLRNDGGEPFKSPTGKFYYQHLSEDQKTRFVELYNEKKMKLATPGYFYVAPYFCKRVPLNETQMP